MCPESATVRRLLEWSILWILGCEIASSNALGAERHSLPFIIDGVTWTRSKEVKLSYLQALHFCSYDWILSSMTMTNVRRPFLFFVSRFRGMSVHVIFTIPGSLHI